MKIGLPVILNAIQDIEDIQGKEQWKEIVHTTLRTGIIMKVRGDFLGPTHSTDKTTLIISFINNQPFCLFDLILYVPVNTTNIYIVQCFTCSYE